MKNLVTLVALLFVFSCSALGQTELEGFAGVYDPGAELTSGEFDSGTALGVRIGQSFLTVLGAEFSYTAVPSLSTPFGDFDETVHLLNGNVLVQLPIGGFVPFATFGVGGISGQEGTTFSIRSTWTWNVGGGLKLRHIAGPVGLRFDARFYRVPDGIELVVPPPEINRTNFSLLELSGGLLLSF